MGRCVRHSALHRGHALYGFGSRHHAAHSRKAAAATLVPRILVSHEPARSRPHARKRAYRTPRQSVGRTAVRNNSARTGAGGGRLTHCALRRIPSLRWPKIGRWWLRVQLAPAWHLRVGWAAFWQPGQRVTHMISSPRTDAFRRSALSGSGALRGPLVVGYGWILRLQSDRC